MKSNKAFGQLQEGFGERMGMNLMNLALACENVPSIIKELVPVCGVEVDESGRKVIITCNMLYELALALSSNDRVGQDILNLYDKYTEELSIVTGKKLYDCIVKRKVSLKNMGRYVKVCSLLLYAVSGLSEQGEQLLNVSEMESGLKKFSKIYLNGGCGEEFNVVMRIGFFGIKDIESNDAVVKDIVSSLRQIVKKSNNKLYRSIARINELTVEEQQREVQSIFADVILNDVMYTSETLAEMMYMMNGMDIDLMEPIGNQQFIIFEIWMASFSDFFVAAAQQVKGNEIPVETKKEMQKFINSDVYHLMDELLISYGVSPEMFKREIKSLDNSDFKTITKGYIMQKSAYQTSTAMFGQDGMTDKFWSDEVRNPCQELYNYYGTYIIMLLKYFNMCSTAFEKSIEMENKYAIELSKQKNITRGIEEEENRIREERCQLDSKIQELNEEVQRLTRENERLKKELVDINEKNSMNEKEIESLKRYVSMDISGEGLELSQEEMIAYLKEKSIIVIGGNVGWISKMQEKLPEVNYIPVGKKYADDKAIQKSDIVLFFTNALSHAQYYHAQSVLTKCDTKMGYLSSNVNIEKSIISMYEVVKKILEG